ncbi:MAG: ABC transporter ATP-binding protein [Clostridia bacterium]|nr:ABC transporter ATP-binding protein [Clostridia bacterium]
MDIIKDSAACTFTGTMKSFVAQYETGVKTNARKQAKYEREVRQAEARAAKGKDYKVAMPTTIDLDLVKENMLAAIRRLHDHYIARNEAEATEVKRYKTDTITDYLMDNAYSMVSKVTKTAARMKALKLMDEVGIPEPRKRYKQYPFEFSGGMRQRIVIAIALAANPDILICDEPTTALDVTIQAQILELIQDLKRRRNLSVIFITHDLGVVANMADRIAVMYAGKIVEYGTSEEVFYEPAHPYTWALLSSMPDLDSKEKLDAIPGTPPDMRYPPVGDAFAERNAYAMKIDFERQPPQFPITETHWAATWLLHPDAPKVEPPEAVTNRIAKMKERMEAAENE